MSAKLPCYLLASWDAHSNWAALILGMRTKNAPNRGRQVKRAERALLFDSAGYRCARHLRLVGGCQTSAKATSVAYALPTDGYTDGRAAVVTSRVRGDR